MDVFVDQLAALARTQVTRNKWVFVPTHAIGRTIGERIALGGTNWLNLRFVTPLDVALRMGAPFLVERGIDPSEEGLGPALMMRLLLDLPDGGYFRPLADQPTMAQALWATLRELRMAGVKGSHIAAPAFESEAKYRELRALVTAYERFLDEHRRGDMASVYEEALRHREWSPILPEDCWTELPDTRWTPLQQDLLNALPGERIAPATLALPLISLPRRLRDRSIDRRRVEASHHPLAFLMSPAASAATSSHGIELFHAGGTEAEIDEVIRRIAAAATPLDRVEIASASDDHMALIWEKALRLEWPITMGAGIPATTTRPGRAVIGLCDWIETDFSASHLRRLLQSGDMGIEREDEGFSAGDAARTIARAEAGWGRATYGLSLGKLAKSYESRARDSDLSDDDRAVAAERAALTTAVLRWVSSLVASIPEPDTTGSVALQQIVDAVARYIEQTTARNSHLDHRAAAALIDHVAELRALGGVACPLAHALRFIRERVGSLQVGRERPRAGHLHVSALHEAGYSGRAHLYVVGLEESRVFPGGAEDPVLLDAERAAISERLRRSTDKVEEAVFETLMRLACAGGRVTLSYSCRDTREFRESYASWIMLQAFRVQRGDPTLSYPVMKAALGEPSSSVPVDRSAATSSAGWWLRSVLGTGVPGIDAVVRTHTPLGSGRRAYAARNSASFTEYDGHVPAAGARLDPTAAGNAYSVTDLESAAGCPHRFFLKRGLHLRASDDRERDKDVWLNPSTRGHELHELYADLLRRARDGNRRPDDAKDRPWLHQRAEARLRELKREMPPATEEIFERESAEFVADLDLFLDFECEHRDTTPVAFEVSFGRPLGEHEEELARAEPVEIDLGGRLKLRIAGRIDRIDQVRPGEFEVLDYKTGVFWRDDWKGVFNGGRHLQHALYGLAAVELLRRRVANPTIRGGTYYFPSHKGGQERVHIAAPSVSQTAAVLTDLRNVIAQGAFAHAPDEKDCKFCNYTPLCGPEANGQSETKMSDPVVQAFARLASHD